MGFLLIIQEIQTFKEFLEDKATSDEIYFFLSCRYALLNGPMLQSFAANFNVYFLILDSLLDKFQLCN